ncbi:MAG: TRAP transporter large permease [Planctomycetaceae bacterium]|nr:TRAP transporter large permease [Planctomycetaceae bacterium]
MTFGYMMIAFAITVFLGFPISISIGIGIATALLADGLSLAFIAQLCFTGLESFSFLAIPLFVLAGYLMETGGLSRRLVNFCSSIIGNVTGGLGIITILACMFFAAISGSSPATVAAIGSMMIPSMVRKGYDVNFSGAIAASGGSLGILIPPSIPMIVYAVTAEVSIGEIFTAGFIPGALIGTAFITVIYIVSRRRGYVGNGQPVRASHVWASFKDAIWAILTPVIILGGIYAGVFTATEAAAIAVLYAMIVGLFIHKELKIREFPDILVRSAVTTASTIIILGFAIAFARYLTLMRIPNMVGQAILSYTSDPTVILCMFVALVFFTGMFMETIAQILIYTPLFLPILTNLGVSPIHFGVILVIGTELGLLTPPVGVNLFVAQGITGSPLGKLSRNAIPFVIAMLICQLLLVFIPKLVTGLPDLVYR